MRIIVCPHDMGTGGSQLNALDLAAGVQEQGHEIMLYCEPGRLVELAESRGLQWVPSVTGLSLSAAWTAGLVRLARSWQADLVHTYEWAPSLGASFGVHALLGLPQVMTVLSMDVPRFLPRHLDLVVGTRELLDRADSHPYRHVIEPPIDTAADAPGDQAQARARWGLEAGDFVVSIIGRMTPDLDKDAGVLGTIAAIDQLAAGPRAVLIAAGDGPSLQTIREAAHGVNERHGREVVIVPGNLSDPSSAYVAADVVVGMGSSVLRGMAFGKPAVVLGAAGFTRSVTDVTLPDFRRTGFYGTGDGTPYLIHAALDYLASESGECRGRGAWSRSVVEAHYSLASAVGQLEGIYRGAITRRSGAAHRTVSLVHSAAGYGSHLMTQARTGGVAS